MSVRAGACPARNDHPIRSSNPFDHHRHVVVVVVVVVVVCDEGDQEDGVGHVQHLVNRAVLSKCYGGRVDDEADEDGFIEAQLSKVSFSCHSNHWLARQAWKVFCRDFKKKLAPIDFCPEELAGATHS